MGTEWRRALLYLYWITFPVLLLLVIEISLAILWENPYGLRNEHDRYTRFHPNGMIIRAKIANKLYEGDHRIRFAVNQNLAISDGLDKEAEAAICLGGSTTESALVPEGIRWPDLLDIPALNYGVSGNTSIDGFYNLKFLLEVGYVSPKYVFLMYGVNDLRAFLAKGEEKFQIAGWDEPLDNLLATIDKVDDEVFLGIRVRDSALFSFVRYHARNVAGRTFYEGYYAQRKAQEGLKPLADDEFEPFLKTLKDRFLPKRESVYREIYRIAKERNISLIFLTQPHAYRKDYHPTGDDLRLFPVIGERKMTVAQSALVMDIINAHTKKVAQVLGQRFLDVDACFSKLSPGEFFYDSVHYSLKGSKQFSECVNQFI